MSSSRIIFCAYDSPGYLAGGPNTWLRRLLPDLRALGFDVHPLVIHSGDEALCPLIQTLRASGFPVRTLSRSAARYVEEQVAWLLAATREIEPAVFVANLVTPAFYAAKWLRQAGIPVVGVLHSDAPFCDAMVQRFVRGDESHAFHAAVCVSEAIEAAAASANPHDLEIVRIPCGAPVPEMVADRAGVGLRVLYAGRITQDAKRALDVARAFCMAADAVPNTSFTIVGSGPEEAALHDIIAGCPRVKFDGALSPDEMPAVFARNDVFVLLSDYEGLPISLLEAMGAGMVPVCLGVRSGVSEVIQNDVNGILVGDREKEFVEAIRRLSDDRDLLGRLGREARNTVEREYSSTLNHKRWAELLERLSDDSRPRPIRVPMHVRLPDPDPAFGSEDLRQPPLGDRVSQAFRSAWFHARQRLRPRARLREWQAGRR